MLLFCPEEWVKTVGYNVQWHTKVRDWRRFSVLARLDQINNKLEHEFLVATTDVEMRGIDLRAPETGVTLVIAKSFGCQRNADQGLMRVCRYGDPGRRFLVKGVPLVDAKQALALRKKLFTFGKAHVPMKPAIKGPFINGGEYYNKAAMKLAEKMQEAKPALMQQVLPFTREEEMAAENKEN